MAQPAAETIQELHRLSKLTCMGAASGVTSDVSLFLIFLFSVFSIWLLAGNSLLMSRFVFVKGAIHDIDIYFMLM